MNLEKSLEKLFSFHNFSIKLGLENTIAFLKHIGDPQNNIKTIHLAGSNGKGSTAAFIASISMEAGYKTGLYTSPHFVKFNERIQINGIEIDDQFVADFISTHNQYIDEHELTFFEVTTAMAFRYFADNKIDYAIIETGLGGRLDATNVLNPLAVVITSISLEHTNILGDKISGIAYEKAEIIKNGSKVFIGKLHPEAEDVVKKKCNEVNCELFRLEDYINEKDNKLELYTEEIEFDDWTMPLKGKFQKYNAALAGLVMAKVFDFDDPQVITDGIKNVIKNTNLQGRYEYVSRKPCIIMDSAHNPAGIVEFIGEFTKERRDYSKTTLIFGAMRDKNIADMLEAVNNSFDEVYVTDINYERAIKAFEIKKIADQKNIEVKILEDASSFTNNFIKNKSNECLVITGSMFLVGEIKSSLRS